MLGVFFENDFEDHLETIGDGPWMGNVSAWYVTTVG